jgi:hypothetical protein
MVNGLGSSTPSELATATKDAIAVLEQEYGVRVSDVMTGDFMTSRDAHGVSLTLVDNSDWDAGYTWDYALSFPTEAFGWTGHGAVNRVPTQPARSVASGLSAQQKAIDLPNYVKKDSADSLVSLVSSCCDALALMTSELNSLDRVTGDGDCGSTHKKGAQAVKQGLAANTRGLDLNYVPDVLQGMASEIEAQMGGSSGAVYALLLTSWANTLDTALTRVYEHEPLQQALYARCLLRALSTNDTARMARLYSTGVSDRMVEHNDAAVLARTLKEAAQKVSQLSGASVGDRTLLDVLLPFANTLGMPSVSCV